MCRQNNRCARQSQHESCCACSSSCCCCGCENAEAVSPTATISMADYESFILVPTSVFDQGDVDCGCDRAW